jgi:hypothetical protein
LLHVPLPVDPQALVHMRAVHVGVPSVHGVHIVPAAPQAAFCVPGWHKPFDAAEQQPPLHGCVALQPGVHWCVLTSQAVFAGQSASELQPHAPLVHAWPDAFVLQSVHARPVAPHAPGALPIAHDPFEQQPPLQLVCVPAPHAVPHRCVDVSHASPSAQSPAALHPHTPAARHA